MGDSQNVNPEKIDRNFDIPLVEGDRRWHDARSLGIRGKGWNEPDRPYERLPAHAEGRAPQAVWNLSHRTAGLFVRFVTDATTISARWTLRFEGLAMGHMPASGVSGLDMYVREEGGPWQWVGAARPSGVADNRADLAAEMIPGRREYMVYLPLYNGVERLAIGVSPEAALEPLPPDADKPVVVYGTSITQGGCASRPGMASTAILGRRLGRTFINHGYSGSGRGELVMAELLSEIDAAMYVIDSIPNMQAGGIEERMRPFVKILRAAHPDTPIVLVESMPYQQARYVIPRQRYTTSNAALRRAYEDLLADGVEGLHYVEGENLIGSDGEATVDGTHFTDVGYLRMSDALEPVLREVLNR